MCKCGQIRAGCAGHHRDQLARDFGGLDAAQANAKLARQCGQPLEQMRQPQPLGLRPAAAPLDAVVPQVNAGQHDLAIAVVDQPPHFVDDVLDRPAGQVRPHAWE